MDGSRSLTSTSPSSLERAGEAEARHWFARVRAIEIEALRRRHAWRSRTCRRHENGAEQQGPSHAATPTWWPRSLAESSRARLLCRNARSGRHPWVYCAADAIDVPDPAHGRPRPGHWPGGRPAGRREPGRAGRAGRRSPGCGGRRTRRRRFAECVRGFCRVRVKLRRGGPARRAQVAASPRNC